MIEQQRQLVCISLRGSERRASRLGARLDSVGRSAREFEALCDHVRQSGSLKTQEEVRQALESDRATAILAGQVSRMFAVHVQKELDAPVACELSVDGHSGPYQVWRWAAWRADATSMDGTEGEDLLVVLELVRDTAAPTDGVRHEIAARPRTQDEAIALLKLFGAAGEGQQLHGSFRPGFYVLDGAAEGPSWTAESGVAAYLFRCYLTCQRAERALMDVRVNGQAGEEFRKLLLARKKLVAVRKFALLKNRAHPASPLLRSFKSVLAALRIEEQVAHIASLAEETTNVMETQNVFVASRRLRSIEAIVFASTVLGLAVAVNAIQMAPFYDPATPNALTRPVFWTVVGVVLGGGLGIWLFVAHGDEFRRFQDRLLRRRAKDD